MDITQSLQKLRDLYNDNLERCGAVSTAVGWNTPESQVLRFQMLTEVIERDGAGFSVNDYGCGYGAHLDHLIKEGMPVQIYHGYDISPEMLAAARERHAGFPDLHLYQSTAIDTEADYTFVSGTFNVKFEASDEDWSHFIVQRLDEINRWSRRGFSFNLLTTYVDWKEPNLFYGDPLFWFDHCKRNYSRYVSLLHDSPLYEWTMLVKK